MAAYAEWLQRGREHQWQGRPVDAMLCFQRAAALAPDAVDARYLLGEVQWQLGAIPAAIGAWREAARIAPAHLASHLALAEACIALGDIAGARQAAQTARALAPDDADAATLDGVARLAENADAPIEGLAAKIAERPGRIAAAPTGRALARALDTAPAHAATDALLGALADHAGEIAYPLLASLAERTLGPAPWATAERCRAIAAAAHERPVAPDEVDALRRVALAWWRKGQRDLGTALANRYGEAVRVLVPRGSSPIWPRRTRGEALRVAVLLPHSGSMATAAQLLRRAGAVSSIEWTLLTGGEHAAVTNEVPGTVLRVDALDATAAAAAIAQRDCDVLLDLAGLTIAAGPLIALRAARCVVAVALETTPLASSLFDAVVDADPAALADWLAAEGGRARSAETASLSAVELAKRYERAVVAHREGRLVEALADYEAVLEAQPDHAPTLNLAASVLREAGESERAAALLAHAVEAAPDYSEARIAAARQAREAGHVEAGLALIDAGLARDALRPALLRARGELLLEAHDAPAAERIFTALAARSPVDADAHYNLGVALQRQGRANDAARAYQRALAFSPHYADAHFNLGVLFQERGLVEAATSAYEAVLARNPRHVAAYRNLGETLLSASRIDAWTANFRRFEKHCPDALPLAVQALEACQYLADHAGLERYLDGLRRERFKARDQVELVDALEQLLYLLLFFDVEPAMTMRFAQTYSATAPKVYGEPLTRPAVRAPGRIRIGYLSADLRDHVMGKQMWQAIQHHDRSRFALHFYSLSKVSDAWTDRFRSVADGFSVIAGHDEHAAARIIDRDDLDLLVDLSGHTRGGKPGILAQKPARVQITHMACPGAVGLSTVDFKLTDGFAEAPGNQAWHIETLLPMEGSVYPFRRAGSSSGPALRRDALGIGVDAIVIGTFVNPSKLSRRCLALWREILARLPSAVLAFSPQQPALQPVFERLAKAAGISAERIVFLPPGRDEAENQARYAVVDLVLDTMPYGGVNGVIEPLDAGVPVVTLVGQKHGERSAYSILANLGVTDTVAQTGPEYVELAVRLGQDRAYAASVRARIQEQLARSPYVDGTRYAQRLEAAYLEALAQKASEVLAGAARG